MLLRGVCSYAGDAERKMGNPCSEMGTTYQTEKECPKSRSLRLADGLVEAFCTSDEIGKKLFDGNSEGAGNVDQIFIGDPHEAGLNLGDLDPGGMFHPEELQFDGKIVLRPSLAASQPAHLRPDDIEMFHAGE